MKTFRLIGMALLAIVMCVNFAMANKAIPINLNVFISFDFEIVILIVLIQIFCLLVGRYA